jgi:hypothetical protein
MMVNSGSEDGGNGEAAETMVGMVGVAEMTGLCQA